MATARDRHPEVLRRVSGAGDASEYLSMTITETTRRICFVTGTRAEFGLMEGVLRAVRGHPKLRLQLVVTGMHLDRGHGRTIEQVRAGGWRIDATVPWRAAGAAQAV